MIIFFAFAVVAIQFVLVVGFEMLKDEQKKQTEVLKDIGLAVANIGLEANDINLMLDDWIKKQVAK